MNLFEFEKNIVAYSLTLLKKCLFFVMNQPFDFGKSIVAWFLTLSKIVSKGRHF